MKPIKPPPQKKHRIWEIPKRIFLPRLHADQLRKAIQRGFLSGALPGERTLCREMRVCRSTLRMALAILRDEGLIQIRPGMRTMISRVPSRKRKAAEPSQIILVYSKAIHAVSSSQMLLLNKLQLELQKLGHKVVEISDLHMYSRNPTRTLNRLVNQFPASCWVLLTPPSEVQQWFYERHLHAVVWGSCHKDIPLPSIDTDYHALCRHAVGVFMNRGHRHIALLIVESSFTGDVETEAGFQEGFRISGHRDGRQIIVRHDGSTPGLIRGLEHLFQSQPRPTALLVSRAVHTLTTMGYLASLGIRIPAEVSLICRSNDPFLDHTFPRVARYIIDENREIRTICRIIEQIISSTVWSTSQHRMLARLEMHQTVAEGPRVPVGKSI